MRRFVFASAIFLNLNLIPLFAQDVDLSTNTDQYELLHVENLGTTDKTAIHGVSNTNYGIGLQLDAGYEGVVANVYTPTPGLDFYTYAFNGWTYGGASSGNFGVYVGATGDDGSINYGVYSIAEGGASSQNFGIYSYAVPDGGTSFAGYFDGDVTFTGSCTPCSVSDETLKQNIRPLTGGLSKVMSLKPSAYEMRVDEYKEKIALGQGTQFGLIAQDVQSVVPELVHPISAPAHLTHDEMKKHVKKTPLKLLALNYTGFIPIILEAMQEQEAKIDSLETEVQQLQAAGK